MEARKILASSFAQLKIENLKLFDKNYRFLFSRTYFFVPCRNVTFYGTFSSTV